MKCIIIIVTKHFLSIWEHPSNHLERQAHFKHPATAVLSWLDCSTTVAWLGFRRQI